MKKNNLKKKWRLITLFNLNQEINVQDCENVADAALYFLIFMQKNPSLVKLTNL